MDATAHTRDKFSISYSLWVGALFLLLAYADELDRIFNLWLLLVPLLLLPTIVAALAWIIGLVRNLYSRRWRRFVSVLAAPAIAFLVFWGFAAAGITPQRISFEYRRQYYFDEIAKLPKSDAPRLKTFGWGVTGGVSTVNTTQTLVYDESDEIALPPNQRSKEWYARAYDLCPTSAICSILNTETQREMVSVSISKMRDHFYVVVETYQ